MSRILIVIGTVNYPGGAHVATLAMVEALNARGVIVDFMTGSEPKAEIAERMKGSRFFIVPFPTKGFRWFVRGVCNRLHLGWFPAFVLDPTGKWRRLAAAYDTIAVIGENSHYRGLVAAVPKGPKKVVFIHTDYARWRTMLQCDRDDSRQDARTYRKYDVIAVIGKANAERFAECHPHLKDKVKPFRNLIKFDKSKVLPWKPSEDGAVRLATVMRVTEISKDPARYVRVVKRLKEAGCRFSWTIYGDGDLLEPMRNAVVENGLEGCLKFVGYDAEAKYKVGAADLFVLLSHFEGLPNVIYDALLAGTPVFATKVGAIADQIMDGETGRLIADDEVAIVDGLVDVVKDPVMIDSWRKNLTGYRYDNDAVVNEHLNLLGVAS